MFQDIFLISWWFLWQQPQIKQTLPCHFTRLEDFSCWAADLFGHFEPEATAYWVNLVVLDKTPSNFSYISRKPPDGLVVVKEQGSFLYTYYHVFMIMTNFGLFFIATDNLALEAGALVQKMLPSFRSRNPSSPSPPETYRWFERSRCWTSDCTWVAQVKKLSFYGLGKPKVYDCCIIYFNFMHRTRWKRWWDASNRKDMAGGFSSFQCTSPKVVFVGFTWSNGPKSLEDADREDLVWFDKP